MNSGTFPRRGWRSIASWSLTLIAGVSTILILTHADSARAFKLPKFGGGKKAVVGSTLAGAAARAVRGANEAKQAAVARGDSAAAAAGIQLDGGANTAHQKAGAPDTSTVETGVLDEILLAPEPYYYESIGRRDPFVSLVSEGYLAEKSDEDRTGPEDLSVVGILWSESDRYALVETPEGKSLILREGDRYGPASVTRINPDGVTLYVSEFGVGRQIRLLVIDPKQKRANHDSGN
ncbi:MAG: hypothetical protein U0527_02900 [Candidatus Eisenbacteria bacterium]